MKNLFRKLGGMFLGLAMLSGVFVFNNFGDDYETKAASVWAACTGSITAGQEYLIVNTAGTYAMNPANSSTTGTTTVSNGNYSMISFSASTGPDFGFVFEDAGNGKFYIKDGACYVRASGTTNNGLGSQNNKTSSPTQLIWTIAETSTSGQYTIISDTSRQISAYGTTNWRSYSNTSGSKTNVKIYKKSATPITKISLSGNNISGDNPNYSTEISSNDSEPKAITVALTPTNASDQKVNIAHSSGINNLFIFNSNQITCSSGTGSFTITGTGGTNGTETFAISGNTETSVVSYLTVTAIDASKTFYTVTFDSDGGSLSPSSQSVEENSTFIFPDPGEKNHHSLKGWSCDGTNFYAVGATSPVVVSNIEYKAYWTEDAKYSVTYKAGEHGSGSDYVVDNLYAGNYVLVDFATTGMTANEGYIFKDYIVSGIHKNPGETFNVSANTFITVNFELKPLEDTYNFEKNFSTYATKWDTTYTTRNLSGISDIGGNYAANINLYFASKQTSTIKTLPVFATKTKSGNWTKILDFTLTDNKFVITDLIITFKQWTTKTPDVALFDGLETNGTPLETITISESTLTLSSSFETTEFSLGYCDKSTSNVQSAIESIYIKLRSSNIGTYASNFLSSDLCDGGVTAPSSSTWITLSSSFSALSAADQAILTKSSAFETGTSIQQCLARYDYIVGKYGTASYSNFMSRSVSVSSQNIFHIIQSGNNSTWIIVAVSLTGLTAIGGYFFYKKRKEN